MSTGKFSLSKFKSFSKNQPTDDLVFFVSQTNDLKKCRIRDFCAKFVILALRREGEGVRKQSAIGR